jgi:nitrogenase iron protein NifH
LAGKIHEHTESKVPSPLEIDDLRAWSAKWADQLLAIEAGEVRGEQAAI